MGCNLMRRRQRHRCVVRHVGAERNPQEISLPPPDSRTVDPKIMGADEQLELLGQRHMLPDGDPGSTD
jgi:hypothetical protein